MHLNMGKYENRNVADVITGRYYVQYQFSAIKVICQDHVIRIWMHMDGLPWRLRDPSISVCFLVSRYSVKLQVIYLLLFLGETVVIMFKIGC